MNVSLFKLHCCKHTRDLYSLSNEWFHFKCNPIDTWFVSVGPKMRFVRIDTIIEEIIQYLILSLVSQNLCMQSRLEPRSPECWLKNTFQSCFNIQFFIWSYFLQSNCTAKMWNKQNWEIFIYIQMITSIIFTFMNIFVCLFLLIFKAVWSCVSNLMCFM